MKKIFLFLMLIFALVLSGCIKVLPVNNEEVDSAKSDDVNTTDKAKDLDSAGIANPASVNCLEKGGELQTRENEDGQYGVCKFSDGSECEEWKFFRGECEPLAEKNSGKENQAGEEIKTEEKAENTNKSANERIKIADIKAGDTLGSPVTISGEGAAFENNLIVELRNPDHSPLVKEFVSIKSSNVGETGPFSITLNFLFNNTEEGFLAVYEPSAQDGSELNLVEIPVKFN